MLIIGFPPLSCDHGNCGDLSNYPKVVAIEELGLDLVKISSSRGNLRLPDHYEIDSSAFYHKDSVGFYLEILRTQRIAASLQTCSFGNPLWACSPAPPDLAHPLQRIIAVSRLQLDYNDQITTIYAGDTISDLFEFTGYGYRYDSFRSLSELKEDDLQDYQALVLKLRDPNKDSIELSVDFYLELTDGRNFNFPDKALKLVPAN